MKIILTVLITLAVAGAAAGWWVYKGNAPKDDVLSVRTELVGRGDLIEIVQSPAEVQPLTKVSISAKVAARVLELPFKEGQKVSPSDVLVKLDASDLEAALRSAQARYAAEQAQIQVAELRVEGQKSQLEGQRATLADAERDLQRQQGLLASHDVSQSIVDTAQRRVDEQRASVDSAIHGLKADETNLIVLRHNLEAADADIARAKENLSNTVIVSPIAGLVTVINAKVGEVVVTGTMNNPGTVILEVADLSQMIAQARVDETDVTRVEVGQPVKVRCLAFPDEVFMGKVTSVGLAKSTDRNMTSGSSADAKVFKVEVLLDPQNRRIPSGLTADVEIQTRKNENVLRVPTQAVVGRPFDSIPASVRDGNHNVDSTKTVAMVVFRVIDGKAVVTPVSVGAADNNYTLIKGGLSEGDRIITGPYKALETVAQDQKVKDESPTTKPATQTSQG
ncbi:MAG TPA: efflux RND transporter periplasmic adaptor subunit [Tepidisphaeraceae bacterium]|nr:efflux RND transporter periplasmic adaptor subunit [Tepidisphaeraceae bacterium]